ncbi:MAG: hypothetical protein JWR69_4683 [Pedosphaera sp.]|nr:hypothetical protein [Pedosphaera sp.]
MENKTLSVMFHSGTAFAVGCHPKPTASPRFDAAMSVGESTRDTVKTSFQNNYQRRTSGAVIHLRLPTN